MFKMFKKKATEDVEQEVKIMGRDIIKLIRNRYGSSLTEAQAVATIMATISIAIATTKGTRANPAAAAEYFMSTFVHAFPNECQVTQHSVKDSAQTSFGFVPTGKTVH